MYYTLEKVVFSFKSHCPQVDRRSKTTYEVRIMLSIVMLWSGYDIKINFLQHVSMVLHLHLQILDGFVCKHWAKHQLYYLF